MFTTTEPCAGPTPRCTHRRRREDPHHGRRGL